MRVRACYYIIITVSCRDNHASDTVLGSHRSSMLLASLLIQCEFIAKILIKAVFLLLDIKLKVLFLGCIAVR